MKRYRLMNEVTGEFRTVDAMTRQQACEMAGWSMNQCLVSEMTDEEVFIISGITSGLKAKLTRIAKNMRQVDLAAVAHVDTIDVTRLENDRYVLPTKRLRIIKALGLVEPDNERTY